MPIRNNIPPRHKNDSVKDLKLSKAVIYQKLSQAGATQIT